MADPNPNGRDLALLDPDAGETRSGCCSELMLRE